MEQGSVPESLGLCNRARHASWYMVAMTAAATMETASRAIQSLTVPRVVRGDSPARPTFPFMGRSH